MTIHAAIEKASSGHIKLAIIKKEETKEMVSAEGIEPSTY
jgi:hypothetical protein